MPRVKKGESYNDKSRGKRVSARRTNSTHWYYDTKTGKSYGSEWEYRDKQARKTEGRTAYQRQVRRKKLRSKGKTPKAITAPRRRRANYDVFDGLTKQAMIRRCRASKGTEGYVQAFVPGDYDHGQGGSDNIGKDDQGREVIGFWVTRSLVDLATVEQLMSDDRTERWIDLVDPFGVGVVWRVLRKYG